MLNPITNSRKNILLYTLVWVVIFTAHLYLISLAGTMPLWFRFLESFLNISFLYALGIGIWHITVAQKNEAAYSPERWIGIFVTGLIIISLWQVFTGGIAWLIDNKSDAYSRIFLTILPYRLMFGFFTYLTLTIIYHNILVFNEISMRKLREEQLRSHLAEQELNMLWSQINPHFLFNSLNSISALTLSDPMKAYDMIIRLADFLRFTINTRDHQLHTLTEELEICDRYMDIEKIRFGTRITYEKMLANECRQLTVPRLIIQPLLENALKHGAYETLNHCTIRLDCQKKDDCVFITIKNSYDPESVQLKKGRGIGIENIKQRLQLIYPHKGTLTVNKTTDTFIVTLQIPINTENA
ncbi:MAG: GHKL domain-containing protein [Bacteroidia bacterium]|nr:GHKL domain-containing protein [Bacteroidia bacterium]